MTPCLSSEPDDAELLDPMFVQDLEKINRLRGGGAEAPLPSSVVEGSASILSGGHIFRQGAEVFSLFIFVAVFHTAVESVVLV